MGGESKHYIFTAVVPPFNSRTSAESRYTDTITILIETYALGGCFQLATAITYNASEPAQVVIAVVADYTTASAV